MWTDTDRESPAPGEVLGNAGERQCATSLGAQALQEVLGDLQTPVALLELSLGFLSEVVEPQGAQARSALRDARRAARRIQRYIDHFVNGEVAGRAALRALQRRVDVDALLRILLDDYAGEAALADKRLLLDSRVAPMVRCDEALLERAFQTLIETALEHARPGQSISLHLSSGSVVGVQVSIAGAPGFGRQSRPDPNACLMAARARRPHCGFEDCEIAFRRLSAVVAFERPAVNHTEIWIQLPAAAI